MKVTMSCSYPARHALERWPGIGWNHRPACVESAEPDGISLDVSTYDWVVVPIPVLVKAGLCLVVLPREAQVVG